MIDPHLYAAFALAALLLMLMPGPNVALIVANSVAYGPRVGLLTVAGTSTAMAGQLLIASIGLAPVIAALGDGVTLLRWAGAVYLVLLGLRQWRAHPVDLTSVGPVRPERRAILGRALLVSLTNPKTLLFYGAFFPQFVAADRPAAPQILLLALTFLVTAVVVDSGWALLAARARPLLTARGRLRNRLSGGLLIGAGTALAFARR